MEFVEFSAKTVNDAIIEACQKLQWQVINWK